MPKKFLLIILVVLLLTGAGFIVYFLFKEDINNLGETITGDTVEIPVEGEPTKDTLLLSLLAGAIDFDSQMAKLKTEGYKNNFFIADVSSVDTTSKKLTLELIFEANGVTETEEKIVSANCTSDKTSVLAQEDLEIITESADFFDNAKSGYRLVSYCLDDACSLIGKECILIKFNDQ